MFRETKDKDKKEFIQVTDELQALYDKKFEPGVHTLGIQAAPGSAASDGKEIGWQAQRDWNNAASGHGAEVWILNVKEDGEKILLADLLKRLYEEKKDDNVYGIVHLGGYFNFQTIQGLKEFFKDYLFSEVDDEATKELLATDALSHLHQAGLNASLNYVLNANLLESYDLHHLRQPSVRVEVYKPLINGVFIESQMKVVDLMKTDEQFLEIKKDIHGQPLIQNHDPIAKTMPAENPFIDMQSELRIVTHSSDPSLIEHKIDKAEYAIHDELQPIFKDFIFAKGFIKNYPEKKEMLDRLFKKINALEKEKDAFSKADKKKTLLEIVKVFKSIDLNKPTELLEFQKFLRNKMKEVDTFATVAGEYFTKFTGGELGKNKTYQLLVKLDDFISAKKQLAEEKRKQISPGEEEKLVRFIDVTKECQRTYGKPGRITPLGGTAAGPDYHKKDQALVDWQRGLNSIFIMHSDSLGESRKKVLLKNIIQNIYDTEGKDNKYGIYPSGSDKKHINFNTTAGLKKFFEDYLFVDVKNASEKKALADSAYLHFHQLGLSNPVGTVVTSDDLQTATTKSLGEPTRWEEVYVPTADGVLCENCQEFSNLKIDMQLQAPTQGPYMDLRSKTKISWDKDVGIKHEILQGNILVKNERVKDYEFGMGFVKNYPDKKVMFNKLLQKRDELQVALEQENKDKEEKEKKSKGKVVAKKSDHKPKRGKIDALEVAIELFRHVDLSNREDLSAFQEKLKDISIGLNSTPESRQTSFSKIKAKVSGLGIMKKISPNTTTLLQELSEFISTQQQSLRNT